MSVSKLRPDTRHGESKVIRGLNYEAEIKYSSFNQRIVIKSYAGSNLTKLGNRLKTEAERKGYGKIWVKVKASDKQRFVAADFMPEAKIKDYYLEEDAVVMAFYPDEERSQPVNKEKEEQLITELADLEIDSSLPKLDEECEFKFASFNDVEAMTELYKEVFDSYPTPIFETEYIKNTIEDNVVYGLIYRGDDLVAAASAETNPEFKNAEMTDFATLPSERGQGYASYILDKLEKELKRRNYHTLYSIARAKSYGMNRVFKLAGYEYTGRLIQNCHIAGDFEDMNLWCKVIN